MPPDFAAKRLRYTLRCGRWLFKPLVAFSKKFKKVANSLDYPSFSEISFEIV